MFISRYDYRAGFWGVMGGPGLGIIPVTLTHVLIIAYCQCVVSKALLFVVCCCWWWCSHL